MSKHEFNEDDLYDDEQYVDEEEDELSPEDKASMELGVERVKETLGANAGKVTLKQIQDALWHYFYDVDKSVAYLVRTYIAPVQSTPKKAKNAAEKATDKPTKGKLEGLQFHRTDRLPFLGARDQHSMVEPEGYETKSLGYLASFSTNKKTRVAPNFFDDMPWLNVPEARKSLFIKPPTLPGGLLGGGEGSGKVSKLQALAASRKKKTDIKKTHERIVEAVVKLETLNLESGENNAVAGFTQISQLDKKENSAPTPVRIQMSAPIESSTLNQQENSRENEALCHTMDSEDKDIIMGDQKDERPNLSVILEPVVEKAVPSAFARCLFEPLEKKQRPSDSEYMMIPSHLHPMYDPSAFDKPSPDEIVLAAQAKAAKKAPATPRTTDDASKHPELTSSVSRLKVTGSPPPKSQGLDVIKLFEENPGKNSACFVVVGHVDAGKSTLMGRLLLDLNVVDQRTVDKYRRQGEKTGKQSFALAWVMDQRSEERERGVTIDIATSHFETPTTKFTILDAPGHQDFVPNMIAGASQADFAILVIDANTGAYEKGLKGQTREHVLLLRSLGVQRLVVAVNKLDMVGWSQERFNQITDEVSGFVVGLGFQSKFVTFIPISGLNGENIVRGITDPAASWYTGPTLIGGLEASKTSTTRALKKPFRMAISELYRSQLGTMTLAGRIDAGTIQVGDVLLVQPSGETAHIKSIMVDTAIQDWAVAGQNVSIAVDNIDPIHIRVGDIICHQHDPIEIGDTFTMKAMAFNHLMPMPVDLHRGRLHAAGQILSMAATLDKATGAVIKKKPKIVQPGDVARIRIKLETKVPLESGQRVVIRSGGETIAAGLLE